MKEQIKNQKGFIPLLIIIIASIIVASAGTGVVLQKQGKLTPFIANVSEVFTGVKEEVSQSEINQEEVSQQELERAKLEVDKNKQEAEKAQTEAERLKKVAEEAKIKAEQELQQLEAQRLVEKQRIQEELQRQEEARQLELQYQQQLKIEKCKAQAQSTVDKYKQEATNMYFQALETFKNWERAILDNQIKYSECIMKPAEPGMPSYLQQQIRAECDYYLERKSWLENDLTQQQNKWREIYETAQTAMQQQYSGIYLKCLNK